MGSTRFTIAHRLGAGFAILLALMVVLVFATGWRLAENDRSSLAVEAAIARTRRIDELERAILMFAVSTRDALLERSPRQLQQFATSESQLTEAFRAVQAAEQDGGGGARANALVGPVRDYLAAARRAVDGGNQDLAALAAMRTSLLDDVGQLLRQHEVSVAGALQRMHDNRGAAVATLAGGAAVTCLLFLAVAWLTVRSVRAPARELVSVASALRAGKWQPALALRRPDEAAPASRFELAQISEAFGAAADALELREQRVLAQGQIAAAAGASLDRSEVAEASLRAVIAHVKAEVGVIYVVEADTVTLVPVATYAPGAQLTPVSRGEGIVGQCARDGQRVVLRDIPADSGWVVKLGFDQAPARMVAAVPILFNQQLVGVLLVASLRDLDAGVLAFLDSAAAQVGVGLANARAYREVEQLLAKVRAQGEEIQVQNEELQAQSEEIQAQNEELQAQSEEIQAQNQDLQRQAAVLREQAATLRDADDRKNHFLGVLAHELRNPLAPISNCVELLQRSGTDASVSARAQQVLVRQVRHMRRLIDDLMDVTRISRGKVVLRPERLNVTELVEDCVSDQRAALEQRGIVLALELPEVPIHVEGDHTRLCQVFSNLLTNAIKFCDPGTRLSVTVTLDAPAREVAIHVADEGAGIDADFLSRIFEPFTQGEDELARSKGGLGLGLALAKGLVELHGGRMAAHSEGRGRGAEFIVTLPLAPTPEHAAGPAAEEGSNRQQPSAVSRVLVIDDNRDAADSLAQLLSLDGKEVEVAYTAREGLEMAQRFAPHAVLCDIGLPGMDGYAFAREMRRIPALRSVLLIALTGYGSPSDQANATDAGFDVHMAKPPELAALLDALNRPAARVEAG